MTHLANVLQTSIIRSFSASMSELVRGLSRYETLALVLAQKRIYPFHCRPTYTIAKQFAFKELVRLGIQCFLKIQYECINLFFIVQEFSSTFRTYMSEPALLSLSGQSTYLKLKSPKTLTEGSFFTFMFVPDMVKLISEQLEIFTSTTLFLLIFPSFLRQSRFNPRVRALPSPSPSDRTRSCPPPTITLIFFVLGANPVSEAYLPLS